MVGCGGGATTQQVQVEGRQAVGDCLGQGAHCLMWGDMVSWGDRGDSVRGDGVTR